MTIDEAIESSNDAVTYLSIHHQARLAQAVKMGEEALKRIQNARKSYYWWPTPQLPGETTED